MITAYGNGGFRVSGRRYSGSVVILSDRTTAWAVSSIEDIDLASLTPILEAAEPVSILVVGCGRSFAMPPTELRQALEARGIALEWMDTGAACRTFNVLMLEGRDAAAALIATG